MRIFSGLMSRCTMLRSCCERKKVSRDGLIPTGFTYQVFDSLKELDEDVPSLVFRQLRLHDNVVEQFPLCRELEDQVHAVVLDEGLLEAQHARVANGHENCNLLLQALGLRPLICASASVEDLDRVSLPRRLLDAQVYRGEVTLPELLLQSVLLTKPAGTLSSGVAEGEPNVVHDPNLVVICQLATVVSADDGLLDERAVAREIFKHGDRLAMRMLGEDNAVAI